MKTPMWYNVSFVFHTAAAALIELYTALVCESLALEHCEHFNWEKHNIFLMNIGASLIELYTALV